MTVLTNSTTGQNQDIGDERAIWAFDEYLELIRTGHDPDDPGRDTASDALADFQEYDRPRHPRHLHVSVFYLVKATGALRTLVSELNTVTCTVCFSGINCSMRASLLMTRVVKPPSSRKSEG